MTKAEFKKYLGKNVKITLFDGDVIKGVLHKTGEEIFRNEPYLYLSKNRYFCSFGSGVTGGISCIFRVSHIKRLKEIE